MCATGRDARVPFPVIHVAAGAAIAMVLLVIVIVIFVIIYRQKKVWLSFFASHTYCVDWLIVLCLLCTMNSLIL